MKNFLDDNFLLFNDTAKHLYHTIASKLPIVDYHNHLNAVHLAQNKTFDNLASLWISEDPYKHRSMRINGIPENSITGKVPDREKYDNWVKTFPYTLCNPLFHWSCMELKHVFGIEEPLTEKNANAIWEKTKSQLNGPGFGALDILKKWDVDTLCTSDDLTDDISHHVNVSAANPGLFVLPSLRSDSILAFDKPTFAPWLKKLSELTGIDIKSLDDYQAAINSRLDKLAAAGCVLSDHAIDPDFTYIGTSEDRASGLFASALAGKALSVEEVHSLKSYFLYVLGKQYASRSWTMQLHIGAQRSTSSRLRNLAGPAGGYAAIGSTCDINALCSFLDSLEKEDALPATILYTLNPADNAAFATLTGSFAQDGFPGKIQFGPAWWYNDQYEGIQQQLIALSSYGLLSHFIGMTTDSRSILSLSRHEYFRRILCDMLGKWVEEKKLPSDEYILSRLITDVCYNNIKNRIHKK